MHPKLILAAAFIIINLYPAAISQEIPEDLTDPPREFSVMPFWNWNDTLRDEEIIRQIADFEAHGVYGFVIRPTIGLPENVKWLSQEMIHSMNLAVTEAARRKMYVILYDEGMYPSASSGGQEITERPEYLARGLAKIDLRKDQEPDLPEDTKLITVLDRHDGNRIAIVEQSSSGTLRGLHYVNDGTSDLKEETFPAADILNPDAVTGIIELVYERYALVFGKHFGTTILGIFSDEPSPLGKNPIKGMVPGNISLLPRIKKILGYDITPFLADLWYNDNPQSVKHRNDYIRAVGNCLEEIYYKRLGNWCFLHDIAFMGHPEGSGNIGIQRYFQIQGQDLNWGDIQPGIKALEGQQSTVAKCASSSMLHLGYRRNSVELNVKYGQDFTYDEMLWLAGWCFVRGQNLLIPNGFCYSGRNPGSGELNYDAGPNSSFWNDYKPFADACRRLSWINTDSKHICDLAIVCEAAWLPDRPAKILYQNQRDFNYLEIRHLWEDAKITSKGVLIDGMTYSAVIIDSLSELPSRAKTTLRKLAANNRLVIRDVCRYSSSFRGAYIYKTPEDLITAVNKTSEPDLRLSSPSKNIRYRHVEKNGDHYYILFNEEGSEVLTGIREQFPGNWREGSQQKRTYTRSWIDPFTAETTPAPTEEIVRFNPYELKILRTGKTD